MTAETNKDLSPYDYIIKGKKVPPEVEIAAEERLRKLRLLGNNNPQPEEEPVDDRDPTLFPPISRPSWYK